MAEGLRWLYGAVQAQARNSGRKEATGLENMKFEVNGRRILLSLQVPEETVRAALQRKHVSPPVRTPAPQAAPSGGPPARHDSNRVIAIGYGHRAAADRQSPVTGHPGMDQPSPHWKTLKR